MTPGSLVPRRKQACQFGEQLVRTRLRAALLKHNFTLRVEERDDGGRRNRR